MMSIKSYFMLITQAYDYTVLSMTITEQAE